MTLLVLRLAAPLQSWSGYRHAVNMKFVSPTEALPRKSGVAGLIGAALGPRDVGFGSARDLAAVEERHTLHVRVDVRNASTEDFQVLGPLPTMAHNTAERSHRLSTASTEQLPSSRAAGNFPTTVTRRDFLPHSEFIAAVETDRATAEAWLEALRNPVFMPYLGRRSCAPTFPFILGTYDGSASELFERLPWADRHGRGGALAGYEVQGSYDLHHAIEHAAPYTPPSMPRGGQLAWAKENLG